MEGSITWEAMAYLFGGVAGLVAVGFTLYKYAMSVRERMERRFQDGIKKGERDTQLSNLVKKSDHLQDSIDRHLKECYEESKTLRQEMNHGFEKLHTRINDLEKRGT